MSVQVENLEKNMAKLTIEVSAEDFEKEVQGVYLKQRGKITIPGFRKGKAPRKMIEKMYGTGIFFEDAANNLINAEYPKAAQESGLEIVSRPEIDVVQIEAGKPFIFTAEVAVKPEVTLGQYKGVEVKKIDVTVSDEEVEEELKKEQDKNARTINVEDRPAQMGDTVTLDYAGSVDGVAFDGGTADGYALTLGSGSFIPGFEEQLVGVGLEEPKTVEVIFPEDYHSKDLAGKAACFACTIHKIEAKELPELDDEFAKDVSEFDTLEEYKADLKKMLTERAEKAARTQKENMAVEAAVANASMDIPEAMITSQAYQMVDNFMQRLQAQGMDPKQYLQYTGMTYEQQAENMKPQAEKQIRTRLVLEAVVEAEKIEATEEDITKELEEMAAMYGMEADKIREIMGDQMEGMKLDLAVQKAVTFITDEAVEVEKTEE